MPKPQSTHSPDIDIQYFPNGRETDSDHAIVDDLVASVSNSGLSTTHHFAFRKVLELPVVISIVIANIGALLKFFGVADYFKTRMQERAKVDAELAKGKRIEAVSEISESPMVEKLSTLRNRGIVLSIAIHTSDTFEDERAANHVGGLVISGNTIEEIASQVEGYIFHAPALLNLIKLEICPTKISGGVFTELLPTDDLKVQWVLRGSGERETRVLHRDRNA